MSGSSRVVITGMGVVTPIGCDVSMMWDNLLSCKTNIRTIDRFDVSNEKVKIASMLSDSGDMSLDVDKYVPPIEQKRLDLFSIYTLAASEQAYSDAKFNLLNEDHRLRTATIIGSGIGGLNNICKTSLSIQSSMNVSPFFIPSILINMAAGNVAIKYGFKGESNSVVSACATGLHNIGSAYRMIRNGDADFALAGGSEGAISEVCLKGFTSCRALTSNFNDEPQKASRPWDKNRSGFVLGEGSGIVAIERLDTALERGANIYAEIVGYGASCDGYHITSPIPDGSMAAKAMMDAIRMAGIEPGDIDYINAHGTSTPQGDIAEITATKRVFGSKIQDLAISSTKSSLGHMLGASGSVETIICALALVNGIIPATLNLDEPAYEVDGLNLVPHKPQKKEIRYAMNNSFGFGGTNASMIFKKYEG